MAHTIKKYTQASVSKSPALMNSQERLVLLRSVRGAWKNRKSDPIKELARMRREYRRSV